MENSGQNKFGNKISPDCRESKPKDFEWETKLREDNIKVLKESFGPDFLLEYPSKFPKGSRP